jgi:hypothetical protein
MQDEFAALNVTCTSTFGETVPVTYRRGGVTLTIPAIVFEPEDLNDGNVVLLNLYVNIADLPSPPAAGDSVIVRGLVYQVHLPKADTAGMFELKLKKGGT